MVARSISLVLAGLLMIVPAADSCSICSPNFQSAATLRQSAGASKFIVVGTLSNPRRVGAQDSPFAMGETDFNIEAVVQNDPVLGGAKLSVVPSYVPVDAKSSNRYILFGEIANGRLNVIQSRPVSGAALVDYLKGSLQIPDQKRLEVLQYCYKHLDSADADVAADAFYEFAKASDLEIAQLAGKLGPDKFRKLLNDPKTPADQLSMFAYLLGACGTKEDAASLVTLIGKDDERSRSALSGLLGGLIELSPEQGWAALQALIRDPKRPFADKLSAIRTLRFCQICKAKQNHKEIMQGLATVIQIGDLADMAIEDLRRWHEWELTPLVLAQYAKPTHAAPLVRGAIVRYALSCSNAEAVNFVAQLRQTQPDFVKVQEKTLEYEKPVPATKN